MWFICLFLVAGYIRKYGISFFDSARKGFIVYFAFSLITFMIAFIMSILVRSTGKLEYYMDMTYSYNYVTLFIASIGLFYAFIYISKKNINKDAKKSGEIINWLAKYTFGVYLLHENVLIREKWQILLGVNRIDSIIVQILHRSCATGPEPVHSRSLLAGLGYEAGIDGYCNAVSLRRFEERLVERKPVERLLEVLTEPALTRLAELRHSGEVESSFMCKEKFHGLDEESSKRFA